MNSSLYWEKKLSQNKSYREAHEKKKKHLSQIALHALSLWDLIILELVKKKGKNSLHPGLEMTNPYH